MSPKHVEHIINAIKHSVTSSWVFFSTHMQRCTDKHTSSLQWNYVYLFMYALRLMNITFIWKVPTFCPIVLLLRMTLKLKMIWSTCGIVLTGQNWKVREKTCGRRMARCRAVAGVMTATECLNLELKLTYIVLKDSVTTSKKIGCISIRKVFCWVNCKKLLFTLRVMWNTQRTICVNCRVSWYYSSL